MSEELRVKSEEVGTPTAELATRRRATRSFFRVSKLFTLHSSLITLALALLTVSCRGPKIIPDRELAQIFHDLYLINSYVGQNNIKIDSLNVYEPVFASYGYTSEDIQYTIGNFAKRKSARLSDDVVEVAVEMLRRESRHYRRRIEIYDTILLVARERYAEQVYYDSLIRVRRIDDTARLRIVIDSIVPGSYKVEYGYLIDSLDRNFSLRTNIYFTDAEGGRKDGGPSQRLNREQHAKMESTLEADDNDRRLVVDLNGYSKNLTTPRMTVDSLRVTYYPPDRVALWRLARSRYGYGVLDSLSTPPISENHETHLLPLSVDATRTPRRPGRNPLR